MNTIKFLIIGDLHGIKPKIHTKDFNAIICPGDICGDNLRPYIKKWILKRTELNEDHTLDFDQFCPKWKQKNSKKKSEIKGKKILKYLNSIGKPVFLVPGNWDPVEYLNGIKEHKLKSGKPNWPKLIKGLKNIQDIEHKKINYKGLTLIGHGSTSAPEPLEKLSKTKFKNKDQYEEYLQMYNYYKKIYTKLNNHFTKTKNPTIFLTHNVPHNTKLDKVNSPGTYAHNKHYGSTLARKLIEEHQPLLCIGGHIHEGYGKTKIKKTICINAGFGGDVNTLIEIDTKKGKIINIEFLGKNKEN